VVVPVVVVLLIVKHVLVHLFLLVVFAELASVKQALAEHVSVVKVDILFQVLMHALLALHLDALLVLQISVVYAKKVLQLNLITTSVYALEADIK